MSNPLNSDQQLDQAVKEALESYEMPFDSSAWTEMEQQLAAQPKPLNPFKKFSFSLNTIIAVGVVGGGLLIYKLSNSNSSEASPVQQTVVVTEQPEEPKVQTAPVVSPAEANAQLTDSANAPGIVADITTEAASGNSPAAIHPSSSNTNQGTDLGTASSLKTGNKKKSDKTQKISSKEEEGEDFDFMKVADRAAKSSPAFGDQIDPVKGFINPSSESDNVKKEAFNKTSGWGDQVLQTIKSDSTVKEKVIPAPQEDEVSDTDEQGDKRPEKKDRSKKSSSGKDKDSSSQKQEDASGSAGDELAEQTDTTEKPRVKGKNNPKYKGDRTIIDP